MSSPGEPATGAANLALLREALLHWFHRARREMPWRDSRDPYAIWVSEIMLQQTQVTTVTPYYQRFMERFGTVAELAEAPLDEVLRLWAGLGYYSRARNLHAAARAVVAHHGGRFPADPEAALGLPGIGPYTAGAIMSIAFGQRVPAVDGNVERVLTRVFLIQGSPKRPPASGRVRKTAAALAECETPGDLNQALMELGATVCRPAGPGCAACPAGAWCQARASGRQAEFPQLPPRKPLEARQTAAAIMREDGRVLLAKRREGMVWAGLWEFPQADVAGDDPRTALESHVRASLGLELDVGLCVLRLRHGVMNQAVALQVFECELRGGIVAAAGYEAAQWVGLSRLGEHAMSSPHRKIAAHVGGESGRLAR